MAILLGLGLFAGIYMLWLLFRLATFALPLYAGLGVGMGLLHHGHGYIVSIITGLIAGVFTLVAGQILFGSIRSPILRAGIMLLFVLPAGFAGYSAVHGLAGLMIGNGIGPTIVSVVGDIVIAGRAWKELAMPGWTEIHAPATVSTIVR